jgi:hypothetical protein
MNVTKKPEIDPKKLVSNPFIKNFKLPVRTFNKEDTLVKVVEGVNYVDGKVSKTITVDDKAHTKVFFEPEFRDILLGCNENALKLFLFITYQLANAEDYIWINHTMFMKKAYIRRKDDYLAARDELLRYGIIACTQIEGVFWINPFMIFHGNRITKYPNNITERN